MVAKSYVQKLLGDFSKIALDRYPLEYCANDGDRANILQELDNVALRERRSLFHGWHSDDIFIFVAKAYPEELLIERAYAASQSKFLILIHELWRPSTLDWVIHLRRICSLGSFRVFVLVLRMNHCHDGMAMRELGDVIINDLPYIKIEHILPSHYLPIEEHELAYLPVQRVPEGSLVVKPFSDGLLESVIASFVERPHDFSCARQHCKSLLLLCEDAKGLGSICRRLFMFLKRAGDCHCDHYDSCGGRYVKRRDPECRCVLDVEWDSDKEYARALMFCILEFCHRKEGLWENKDCAKFLLQACAHCFSKRIYDELANCLLEEDEHPEIFNSRDYTVAELKENFHTETAVVTHAGCANINCKQNFSRDCENVMCGQHCSKFGTNACNLLKHNMCKTGGDQATVLKCLCCRYEIPRFGKCENEEEAGV